MSDASSPDLFNALNTINALIDEHPDSARHALLLLAELLRRSLSYREGTVCTLREELLFTNKYLGLQRYRYGDRLDVEVSVDPALQDVLVPVQVLQPLLENAVKYSSRTADGRTVIRLPSRGGGTTRGCTGSDCSRACRPLAAGVVSPRNRVQVRQRPE